jgi:hypothetical protein
LANAVAPSPITASISAATPSRSLTTERRTGNSAMRMARRPLMAATTVPVKPM